MSIDNKINRSNLLSKEFKNGIGLLSQTHQLMKTFSIICILKFYMIFTGVTI
jgi:hypothetical protein